MSEVLKTEWSSRAGRFDPHAVVLKTVRRLELEMALAGNYDATMCVLREYCPDLYRKILTN